MTREEIDELKETMCDKYCRMPDFYGGDTLDDICEDCPLNRLEADDEQ